MLILSESALDVLHVRDLVKLYKADPEAALMLARVMQKELRRAE
jgi:hypothetical protein